MVRTCFVVETCLDITSLLSRMFWQTSSSLKTRSVVWKSQRLTRFWKKSDRYVRFASRSLGDTEHSDYQHYPVGRYTWVSRSINSTVIVFCGQAQKSGYRPAEVGQRNRCNAGWGLDEPVRAKNDRGKLSRAAAEQLMRTVILIDR